ncbi:multicopper oxidase family protein [Streptomyces sp. NBC_01340]|uniref:multicopper oxidase family protein n=1 Tax=unclassified Streptomyces TaxID=2593676 RepID=UPI0022557480|nr:MULTISPECIES: multicopper oxidase family protein [unclassified Streptomyces]MCX4453681.1 multicopper oxidase family protein [Streptomyces sp. NBC_01719]MCX4493041.1 multicopper oxidase family protein [Streptomyces sp. NBC_01728]WSI38191.1 multicopper oxidase family protein [Streptomyces sp. NBC_01340]
MRIHTRRTVLGASIAVAGTAVGTGVLSACSGSDSGSGSGHSGHEGNEGNEGSGSVPKGYVDPAGPEVAAAERKRGSGPVRKVRLTAAATSLDLGGRTVRSWAYGGELPGKEVRVTAGDTLDLTLANHLPQSTSLHWHGIALRNDMDGVPGVTQRAVRPGAEFAYRFTVPDPGTYWFHPHSGTQQDRGLYAPLIVEDPKEPLSYDKEWVVVLDDWVDGVDGSTPDAVLKELSGGMHEGMDMGTDMDMSGSHMLMGAESGLLGGDAGDVAYPHYLVNGRTAQAPSTFGARPGDRIRIRIINAAGDTAFRVALGGHEMTVTHTDGFPVRHATTDALLLGMGERYDVLVTAEDGVFPLTALAEGKKASARALLRTGAGTAPAASVRPKELDGRLLTAERLTADESVALSRKAPDRTVRLRLTGGMEKYDWAFDKKPYRADQRHPVRSGERVRLVFANSTSMWHPVHLHGHTFALPGGAGGTGGARKDTAIVLPNGTLTVDFDADNPGLWMIHCHNVYHSEAGMMTILGYRS